MESKLDYTVERVFENKKIAEDLYELKIQGDFKGIPGQFYMLRCWDIEPILWRPVSIHYLDDNNIIFLYHVVGRGTKEISRLKTGDEIKILGPLGNGFYVKDIMRKNVAVITGGIGIAPMFYVAKSIRNEIERDKFHCNECKLDLYAGFANATYCMEKFKPLMDNVYISTETGVEGRKGYITDIFKPENYDMVLCCGPEAMMKKVISMCMEKDVTVYVSMEKYMACGIGACLVCTCNTINGNKRVCTDGPVFLGTDLVI